jgi:hypothetical protein
MGSERRRKSCRFLSCSVAASWGKEGMNQVREVVDGYLLPKVGRVGKQHDGLERDNIIVVAELAREF